MQDKIHNSEGKKLSTIEVVFFFNILFLLIKRKNHKNWC